MAALVAANALAHAALAQQPGVTRNDLQRHDLSVPGREAIQTIVSIAPGVTAPRHSHPGEEIIYVLEGVVEYQARWATAGHAQGRRRLVYPGRSGPLGGKNVGSDNGAELATYIVEKGKPLLTLAK